MNSEASSRSVGEHNVGMTRVRELSESCPADAECDTDSDGVCDGSDSCPYDAGDNYDSCRRDAHDDVDSCSCALDVLMDADCDDVCGDEDNCAHGAANDVDGDNVCSNDELCAQHDTYCVLLRTSADYCVLLRTAAYCCVRGPVPFRSRRRLRLGPGVRQLRLVPP